MNYKTALMMFALLLVVVGVVMFLVPKETVAPVVEDAVPVVTGQATYLCEGDHSVRASFAERGPAPAVVPGEPPVSNAVVFLSLDAANAITLPQVVSADGARYGNADESLVFWSKGEGALVLENGNEETYKNCISVKDDTAGLSQAYLDAERRFTLRYPAGYEADATHAYTNLGPGTTIEGVKFTIPATLATGTNLSRDTYLSVEHRAIEECAADAFLALPAGGEVITRESDGVTYSVASTTDAGAGNRYEEEVYAIEGSSPCLAVRYFIHYTVLENYEPGTVTAFDAVALRAQFDAMRVSLTLDQ